MHITETPAYQKAFIHYLRRGTPIELSLKAMMPDSLHYKMLGNSTHYIWRTQDDGKVRSSHAHNDDQLFAWNSPPETGHPGEDYNCRCWAEPVGDYHYARQHLISPVYDNPDKWTNADFWNHYTARSGQTVTLQEIGHFAEVIDYFANNVITSDGSRGGYQAVENDIIDEARKIETGVVHYQFNRTYKFGYFWDIILGNSFFSLGNSTVSGIFDGGVRKERTDRGGYLIINGIMTYHFDDKFEDPFDAVEIIEFLYSVSRQEAEHIARDYKDKFGEPYDIKGNWQTKLNATVKIK